MKKWKIITLSDHPLISSGVGNQTKYIIEGLLRTGKYQFISVGAAIKHPDYRPQKVVEWGDDWMVIPFDGYGNENLLREMMDNEKPDAIWFMTDPRFYNWLFGMADEIRDRGIPLLYYHVWDNYPVPQFNKSFYESCDHIGCISQLTYDIVSQLGMKEHCTYIPHAVDSDVFIPFTPEKKKEHKAFALDKNKNKFVIFYNSRNARRKMTGDVVKAFSMLLDKVGKDKAFLLMHTDPLDGEGPNLFEVTKMLGLTPENIQFSHSRVPPEQMAIFYNVADATINVSFHEGFGLSCLESLSCGTPVIVNKTGGLQDQAITDDGTELGVVIPPATRSMTGSQQVPYIYEDRNSHEDICNAMLKLYNMSAEEKAVISEKARAWTLKKFNLKNMITSWDDILIKYITEFKDHGYKNRLKFVKI